MLLYTVFIIKTLFPMVITLLWLIFHYSNPVLIYIVFSMFLTLLLLICHFPNFILKLILKDIHHINYNAVKSYFYSLRGGDLWRYIQTLSSGNLLNADKWLATLLFGKELLSSLVLLGQFDSAIVVGMNYITISNRRDQLILRSNSFKALTYKGSVFLFSGTLCLFLVGLILFTPILRDKLTLFSPELIAYSIVAYGVYTVTAIFSKHLFWNFNPRVLG